MTLLPYFDRIFIHFIHTYKTYTYLAISQINFANIIFIQQLNMSHSHSHDGGHDHSHNGAIDHGHTHEILYGPGSYMGREMPIIEGRDWSERAFTVGIGG